MYTNICIDNAYMKKINFDKIICNVYWMLIPNIHRVLENLVPGLQGISTEPVQSLQRVILPLYHSACFSGGVLW